MGSLEAGKVLVRAADGGRTELPVADEAATRAEAQLQAEEGRGVWLPTRYTKR